MAMTHTTSVLQVTVITQSVNLFVGFARDSLSPEVVTVTAVFTLVAVNTAKFKSVDMLLMVKSNNRAFFIWRCPDFLVRNRYHRVTCANNIGCVNSRGSHLLTGGWQMADYTLCIMTPLTVTSEALPMIRALKTGLPKVLGICLAAVTLTARRDMPGRAVMMTGLATMAHLSHVGVKFMIERHRLVQVGEFSNYERVRSLLQFVFAMRGR